MKKNSNQSDNNGIDKLVKIGGIILVIGAGLVLGLNWLLGLGGEELPDVVTNTAETILQNSLEENDTAVSADGNTHAETIWTDANGDFDHYILVLSWQPAFCETASRKTECATQTKRRFDATHFVLHGLWPDNSSRSNDLAYCGQPESIIDTDQYDDWCELPELTLAPEIQNDLEILMPGTASCLDRHEWVKHGSCAGMSDDAYYALGNELVVLFSQTDFNQYVADQIGQKVSRNDLLHKFEDEFGPGSDDYLSLRCKEVDGISLLSEIRIPLKKELTELNDFADLFPAYRVSPQGSCPQEFMIDSVG